MVSPNNAVGTVTTAVTNSTPGTNDKKSDLIAAIANKQIEVVRTLCQANTALLYENAHLETSIWKKINAQFSKEVCFELFSLISFDEKIISQQSTKALLSFLLNFKKIQEAEALIQKIEALPQVPTWWTSEVILNYFSAAFKKGDLSGARLFASRINPKTLSHDFLNAALKTTQRTWKEWEGIIETLVKKKVTLVSLWTNLKACFSKEFCDHLLELVTQEQAEDSAYEMIQWAIQQKDEDLFTTLVSLLCMKPETEHPQWLKNPDKKADLFCAAAQFDCRIIADMLIEGLNVRRVCNGKTPLMYAAERSWDDLVVRLVQQKADLSFADENGKRSWAYICEYLSTSQQDAIFKTISIEEESSYPFLLTLIHARDLAHASAFLEAVEALPTERKPAWSKDVQKKSEIFSYAVFRNFKWLAKKYVREIDPNYIDDGEPIAIQMAMLGSDWKDMLEILIARGARLTILEAQKAAINMLLPFLPPTLMPRKTLLDYIYIAYGEQYATDLLMSLDVNLHNGREVLEVLMRGRHVDAAHLFYTRLQTITPKPPSWKNGIEKTDTFFAASRCGLQEIAISLIDEIDVTRQAGSVYNNKTVLMIAVENGFKRELIEDILNRGASFTQQDGDGESAFKKIVRKKAIPLHSERIKTFLKGFGIRDRVFHEHPTSERLESYLTHGVHSSTLPFANRVAIALLMSDHERVQNYLSDCEFLDKFALIEKVVKLVGRDVKASLIDLAFSVKKAHMQIPVMPTQIPAKKSGIVIDSLLQMATKYAQLNSVDQKALETFIGRVKNEEEYLATPKAKTAAIHDFYTTIDNATCNVIEYLQKKIEALQTKNEGKELMVLVAEEDKEAKLLLGEIRNCIKEYAEAALHCGGRIYMNAVQQYTEVVLNEKQDVNKTILKALALRRENIATSLFQGRQSTHDYSALMRTLGKKLGIPGASAVAQFNDEFVHQEIVENEEQQEALEAQFMDQYTSSDVVEFVRSALKDGDVRFNFITHLQKLGQSQKHDIPFLNERLVMLLIEKAIVLWNTNSDAAVRVAKIRSLFSQAPLFLELEDKDLVSLEALKTALDKEAAAGTLFTAYGQEFAQDGKFENFSDLSIIMTLVAMDVLG